MCNISEGNEHIGNSRRRVYRPIDDIKRKEVSLLATGAVKSRVVSSCLKVFH